VTGAGAAKGRRYRAWRRASISVNRCRAQKAEADPYSKNRESRLGSRVSDLQPRHREVSANRGVENQLPPFGAAPKIDSHAGYLAMNIGADRR